MSRSVPSPTSEARPARRRRSSLIALAVVLAVAVVAAGGYGLWYLFLRPAGPPPVAAASPVLPTASVPAPASLDGEWQVNSSLGSMSDFSASWVGYRVQEQLAGVGANTAVGRTSGVSGSMTLSGSTVTAVTITADLTGLQSDDRGRDGQLRSQAIETDTYPTAVFKTTAPIDLGSLPAEGQVVHVTATGTITLHGVTRTVQIPLNAERQGGIIAVTGSLDIVFADYNIDRPTSFAVLSVDDHGTMELHILFTHS
jgi:polyisoprenoid-binding protein YceI